MASAAAVGATWGPALVRQVTHTPERHGSVRRSSVTGEPTCACGQALEWSHTAHCPRCGITLLR